MARYAGDPEFQALIKKVQDKMGSVVGSGMPMPAMPPGMDKVLSDPDIVKALQDPKMMRGPPPRPSCFPSISSRFLVSLDTRARPCIGLLSSCSHRCSMVEGLGS
jgi:hypothetical protein